MQVVCGAGCQVHKDPFLFVAVVEILKHGKPRRGWQAFLMAGLGMAAGPREHPGPAGRDGRGGRGQRGLMRLPCLCVCARKAARRVGKGTGSLDRRRKVGQLGSARLGSTAHPEVGADLRRWRALRVWRAGMAGSRVSGGRGPAGCLTLRTPSHGMWPLSSRMCQRGPGSRGRRRESHPLSTFPAGDSGLSH